MAVVVVIAVSISILALGGIMVWYLILLIPAITVISFGVMVWMLWLIAYDKTEENL
jgi:hypothetical protein